MNTAIIAALISATAAVVAAWISKRSAAPTPAPAKPTAVPTPTSDTPDRVMRLRSVFIARIQQLGTAVIDAQKLPSDQAAQAIRKLDRQKFRGDAIRQIVTWMADNPPATPEARAAREQFFETLRTEAAQYLRQDRDAWALEESPYPTGRMEGAMETLDRMPPGPAMCRHLIDWFDRGELVSE